MSAVSCFTIIQVNVERSFDVSQLTKCPLERLDIKAQFTPQFGGNKYTQRSCYDTLNATSIFKQPCTWSIGRYLRRSCTSILDSYRALRCKVPRLQGRTTICEIIGLTLCSYKYNVQSLICLALLYTLYRSDNKTIGQ